MSGNFKIGENIARQNIARQTAQGGLLLNEPRLCGIIMSHDQFQNAISPKQSAVSRLKFPRRLILTMSKKCKKDSFVKILYR